MRSINSESPPQKTPGSSISFRLTTSIILTVLVVSVCSNIFWYLKTKQKAEKELEENITRSISSIVEILEMPLWAYDEETIESIGSLYSENELVVQLTIIDSLGKVLFEMQKENSDEALVKTKKIYHNNRFAGSVKIALTSGNYKRVMKQMIWSGIITTIVNVSVLLLLTGFFLRLFLKKPISSLSTIVKSYASGTYEQPDSPNPYMEFQSVVNVVTSMGVKITSQMEELRVAEKKFREIFENAVEGIFQFNSDRRFINVNPAMAKIMGYNSPEALISNVQDIRTDCFYSLDAFQKVEESLEQNNIVTAHEACVKKKTGELIWVSLSLRKVADKDGRFVLFEGSLVDISDKKEREEAEKRQKTADAANQAKTLFIAKMSHEIRTPLNSVLGMTELLKETAVSKNQKEYIDLLYSSGEFLQVIINDILDFSKIEAQQFEIDNTPFDLSEIITDVSGLFAFRAAEKKIDFFSYIDPDISQHFIGDPVRLKQILINIIGNAVKFTNSGSVKVDVVKEHPPEGSLNQEKIKFVITDTGIGIPESKQETILESFTQADSVVTRQFGGTGLGLSICKKLLEHMGSRIIVESREGVGTCFSFSIVFNIAEPEAKKAVPHVPQDVLLSELTILLVDDIEPNRKVIHKFLENFSVTITDADNGREAVEQFTQNTFDLILMDIEMPVMNGLEATRAIRDIEKKENRPHTPLIILSAHAFGEQRQKCFEAGCDNLLVKPIRKKDFLKAVAEQTFNHPASAVTEEELPPETESDGQPSSDADGIVKIDKEYEELFPDFIHYFNESLTRMEDAVETNEFNELYRLGHGLKGSARNYELHDLGSIFLDIENAAQEKKIETVIFNLKKAKKYLDTINVEFVNKG